MIKDVERIVEEYPQLSLKVNVGERHRIMHSAITHGSLWVRPKTHCLVVTPSGQKVEALLRDFLLENFGQPKREYLEKWKEWDVDGIDEVASVIRFFASISRPRRYWAFCANPRRYRIAEAVRDLDTDLWNVGGSDVRAGDQVLIWQTLDQTGSRGIVGLATVLMDPEPQADAGNPYWAAPYDGHEVIPRVPVHYDAPDPLPLWVDSEHREFLLGLSVARAQGGTVFKVTADQWQYVADLVGGWSPAPIDELEATGRSRRAKDASQQGFGLTTAERKAVEDRAMELAQWHFQATWPTVEDVSSKCSYDLLCRNGEASLRVEVKGTTTSGKAVILTKNEVRTARDPGYALFVVSGIQLVRGPIVRATGGQCHVFDPWEIQSARLVPIQYRCELNVSAAKVVRPRPQAVRA